MSDYYDKNQFSGSQQRPTPPPVRPQAPPPRPNIPPPPQPNMPPPPRPNMPSPPRPHGQSGGGNGDWWHSWPVIVILFVVGLWPLALGLLVYNLIQEDQKQRQRNQEAAARWNASRASNTAAQEAVRRAQEKAEEARRQQELLRQAEEAQRALQRDRAQADQQARETEAVQRQREQALRQAEEALRRKEQAFQAAQAQAARQQTAPAAQAEIQPKMPKKFKTPFSSKLMRFFGVLFLICGGIATSVALPDLLRYGSMYLDEAFQSLGFLICGGALFWRGHHVAQLTRRSQRYILAIGNADTMSIDEIAKRVNRTPGKVKKELQKLIDKGYLGEDAYIDHGRGYFLRFGATLEEEKSAPAAPVEEVPEQAEEGYSGILRNIRRANDRIADAALSRKIDRLEQVSGLIFKEVEAHPEKRECIHTFFDYYLPTTQKLLDAYADFEATGVEGENLRQAKERIEQTMDAIVDGFEHQLDQLYSTDAMDVVSDIKVMETMLSRDTASAAKDFGYDQPKPKPKDENSDENGGITLQI